jgi:nitrite reductase (NO-forming)
MQEFSDRAMLREEPNYVLFNGALAGLTDKGVGPMHANVGETVRFYVVVGGPNLGSSMHPIGNIWSRCWPQGAIMNDPMRYVQTSPIAPGSGFVGDMELPVPETVRLVDHSISRALGKGAAADLVVNGEKQPEILRTG